MTRGSRANVTLAASAPFNKVILFASSDYMKSVGDNATFTDCQLE